VKTTRAARVSVWGLLVAGAMIASAPAQAALTVTTTGEADFIGGYRSASINSGVDYKAGGGGIFTFNRTGGTAPALMPDTNTVGKFVGICLEFNEAYTPNGSYTFVGLESAPVAGVSGTMNNPGHYGTRADDLRRFLGHVYPVFGGAVQNATVAGISDADKALAVQLVVWEIASETYLTTRPYSLSTNSSGVGGVFRVRATGSPDNARNQAIAWLNLFATEGETWRPLNNLYALLNDAHPGQDFVVQVVPIPAAAWLLGSGLLGLFAVARRKKTTN
jgi:hypothetical protein